MSTAVRPEPLDAFTVPLDRVVAVEASAGTGKTFTITQLYLRLLLETDLTVGDILVVTYTNAATAELRGRIRGKLALARDAFRQGSSDDEFCRSLLARVPDPAAALRTIERALHGFDEAAVFTIHGFCQRVLADWAFESGVLFDTELVPDQQDLVTDVVADFWRRELYEASRLFVHHALEEAKLKPDGLAKLVRDHAARPYRRVDAPADPGDLTALEAEFLERCRRVRDRWTSDGADVETLLTTSQALKGNQYRATSVPAWGRALVLALDADPPSPTLFDAFKKFTTAGLQAGTKVNRQAPTHSFFTLCDELAAVAGRLRAAYAARVAALRARLLGYAAEELRRRKAERRVQYYDDLLLALDRALKDGPRGEALARALRTRHPAALIDEFQDTDPVQYDIFRRLYAGQGLPAFLVGDPKQAIYGFRGADVFTYLRARGDAGTPRYLDRNWRSVPRLIDAVNAVFGAAARPFVVEPIPFVEARPADQTLPGLSVRGDGDAPLRLWMLPAAEKRLGKEVARELAADATAREIARLITAGDARRAHVGDEPLHGGHVAVLVRTNDEGRAMRERLLDAGVPSVQQAVDSVFASREAMELERVLLAVADPAQGALLRAALATEMLGVAGEDIHQLTVDEAAWEARALAFHEHHHRWREHGFARMLRELLIGEHVAARLLAYDDGERRMTNLLHLGELLQERSARTHGSMDALVEWLADARRAAAMEDDEQQLRLESDERLVKIVTVHKSKGLEYPIVFCPFLWNGFLYADESDAIVFHEDDADARATLDVGSPALDARRALARREELAERVRLLYVALTRAAHRCYVVWGRVNEGGTSPLAWLLHAPPDVAAAVDPIEAVERRYGTLSDADLRADLARLVARSDGAIQVEAIAAGDAATAVRRPPAPTGGGDARRLVREVPWGWSITSFTQLAMGLDAERPDHDPVRAPVPTTPATGRRDVFTFPRGTRPGNCLHKIFERIDFADADPAGRMRVVEATLRIHGYEREWAPVLADMVERVLETSLDDAGTLRLRGVPWSRRICELEFHHPLARLDAGRLRGLLAEHRFGAGVFDDAIGRVRFSSLGGFMKGFIDLVFEQDGRYWLVDYKSNVVGEEPEDYAADRIASVMARHAYWLQYLVYSVVVHRLLALRVPGYDYDVHFGGVRYLFVRGMDPARGMATGVFQDRPARALVEALDASMRGA